MPATRASRIDGPVETSRGDAVLKYGLSCGRSADITQANAENIHAITIAGASEGGKWISSLSSDRILFWLALTA